MSEIEDPSLLKTGIRVIHQRYCLECGKILPTKIKQNYAHLVDSLALQTI